MPKVVCCTCPLSPSSPCLAHLGTPKFIDAERQKWCCWWHTKNELWTSPEIILHFRINWENAEFTLWLPQAVYRFIRPNQHWIVPCRDLNGIYDCFQQETGCKHLTIWKGHSGKPVHSYLFKIYMLPFQYLFRALLVFLVMYHCTLQQSFWRMSSHFLKLSSLIFPWLMIFRNMNTQKLNT